jgi:hypothetical protein
MGFSVVIGLPPAGRTVCLDGGRRDIATTRAFFAFTGIDASPGVVQICLRVRICVCA